jgi:integrase/recombinase XerD
MNPVNIIKMVKVNGKWAFAPVVERDGKIIWDYVLITGKEEHHPEGRYYLDWCESGKNAGWRGPYLPRRSLLRPSSKIHRTSGPESRLAAFPRNEPPEDDSCHLEYVRKQRSYQTYLTNRPTLTGLFRKSYTKTNLDEVTRDDMLKFMSDCFDVGLSTRTIYGELVTVLQLVEQRIYASGQKQ